MKIDSFWVFYAFCLMLPASMVLPENTTGTVLFLFLVVTVYLLIIRQLKLRWTSYIGWSVLLYGVYVGSIFYSEHKDEGLIRLSIKFPLMLLPALIAVYTGALVNEQRGKVLKGLTRLLALVLPYLLAVAVYRSLRSGTIYYTYPGSGEVISTYFTYAGLSEWVIHPAYLALWTGTGLVISVFYNIRQPADRWQWVTSAALLVLMVLLQSRMNLLALLVVLLAMAVVLMIKLLSLRVALVLTASVILGTGIILYHLPSKWLGRFADLTSLEYNIEAETFHEGFNGFTIRLAEWKCAWQEIRKRPLLGSGVGDSRYHLEESYRRNNFRYGYREKFNAHNQFIETTLATGILGLTALIGFFANVVYRAALLRRWHVAAACGYVVLCFLSESYLERQWGVVFTGMMVPLMLETEIALPNEKSSLKDQYGKTT
ncbi:O-antigen ligase family protein [Schleiferia thermophila]|nr:O-antigen ligase family protein [Schleiferia thermophila]KFD39403.1 hypothetical protein AT05_05830 [Schleiferia thermophila str. Yellowstone]